MICVTFCICRINGTASYIPAAPTHGRPACGRGRHAFPAGVVAACGRFIVPEYIAHVVEQPGGGQ